MVFPQVGAITKAQKEIQCRRFDAAPAMAEPIATRPRSLYTPHGYTVAVGGVQEVDVTVKVVGTASRLRRRHPQPIDARHSWSNSRTAVRDP